MKYIFDHLKPTLSWLEQNRPSYNPFLVPDFFSQNVASKKSVLACADETLPILKDILGNKIHDTYEKVKLTGKICYPMKHSSYVTDETEKTTIYLQGNPKFYEPVIHLSHELGHMLVDDTFEENALESIGEQIYKAMGFATEISARTAEFLTRRYFNRLGFKDNDHNQGYVKELDFERTNRFNHPLGTVIGIALADLVEARKIKFEDTLTLRHENLVDQLQDFGATSKVIHKSVKNYVDHLRSV